LGNPVYLRLSPVWIARILFWAILFISGLDCADFVLGNPVYLRLSPVWIARISYSLPSFWRDGREYFFE